MKWLVLSYGNELKLFAAMKLFENTVLLAQQSQDIVPVLYFSVIRNSNLINRLRDIFIAQATEMHSKGRNTEQLNVSLEITGTFYLKRQLYFCKIRLCECNRNATNSIVYIVFLIKPAIRV